MASQIPQEMIDALPPRQRQVFDYFAALPPEERARHGVAADAARALGMSYGNVTTNFDAIRKKLGEFAELVLPAKTARKISDPALKGMRGPKPKIFKHLALMERAAELEIDVFESSMRDFDRVSPHVKAVRTQDLLLMGRWTAARVLASFSDYDIATTPAKDRAIIYGILTEKNQLLAGEPTQIITFEDRRKMPELAAALQAELQRRGREIDVTPTRVEEAAP